MKCGFCGQHATLEATSALAVCRLCANRIGHLAATHSALPDVWRATTAETAASAHAAAPARGADVVDTERVFDELKTGVGRLLSPDDLESHLHLGEAYLAMGLLLDARREAGIAARAPAVDIASAALRILLAPPLLERDGLARLRVRLQAN